MYEFFATIIPPFALLGAALPSFVGTVSESGKKNALLIWGALFLFAIIVETVAISTGWPYGTFVYTGTVGPRLGEVPLLVGIAWPILAVGVVRMSSILAPQGEVLARWAIAVILLVATDFVLDPGAVAVGLWEYTAPGVRLYGVPLSNYLGWVVSGSVGIGLTMWLMRKTQRNTTPLVASSWVATLVLWTTIAVYKGLFAAVITSIVLGGIVVYALITRRAIIRRI